jgi:hypothetical protein
VNDGQHRQVMLVDAALGTAKVVLDSARGVSNFYGPRALPLMPYVGDSTLFPNIAAGGLSLIDSRGSVSRALALPPGGLVQLIRKGSSDNLGRLVYPGTPATKRSAPGGVPPIASDSTPLLRADFASRRIDTVAFLERPLARTDLLGANGMITSVWRPNPLRASDEWAVLTDGSLAIVRGHDYHIDLIRPDGTRLSTPKQPFDWRQAAEADKARLIDSAQAATAAAARNNTLALTMEMQVGWRVMPGDAPPGIESVRTDVDTTDAVYTTAATGRLMVLPSERPSLDQVFDYFPAVRSGSVMADLDNHLWVLPTTSKQSKAGELVYDVFTSKGDLLQRVRAPLGRYVIGFGRRGVVYLASGNLTSGFTVERALLPSASR